MDSSDKGRHDPRPGKKASELIPAPLYKLGSGTAVTIGDKVARRGSNLHREAVGYGK